MLSWDNGNLKTTPMVKTPVTMLMFNFLDYCATKTPDGSVPTEALSSRLRGAIGVIVSRIDMM